MEREKQTEDLLRHITLANSALQQFAQGLGDKLYDLVQNSQAQDGLLDVTSALTLDQLLKRHSLEEETSAEDQLDKPSFFSQITLLTVDESIEEKILNFKLNFVTNKRREELFKKYKQQQQEKYTQRKKYFESKATSRLESFRITKGEFTLKRGTQTFTCAITGDDLDKLRPEMDLNDTIIANYLKYLQTEVFSEEAENASFIFSSFFIEKLVGEMLREEVFNEASRGWHEKTLQKVGENYKNVKRWTKKVDIFEKDYLVVPINSLKHWFCVIIVNLGSLLNPNPGRRPYIVYCDSMCEKKTIIVEIVRAQLLFQVRYLQIELEDKKGIKMEINEQNLPCYQLLLPRQTNMHDCGMYMMTYIEHLITKENELQDLHIVKNRDKLHLFPRILIFSMRQRLKDFFINLIQTPQENAKQEIIRKYKEETQLLIREADEADYDKINFKELKKYESINASLLELSGHNVSEMTQEEIEFALKIRFYIDPDINYYEKDKNVFVPMMM